ncbi:hypothetical protein PR048_023427 [Dryococelus australis]|uniref:Uncharacterized protein n=1 Tax=Dryococelus australis TaxID=614101 RepID=A0ABQ9GU28_9NEOP|nr:hypothetical protein PR048_023427 [Dryococelus australis]
MLRRAKRILRSGGPLMSTGILSECENYRRIGTDDIQMAMMQVASPWSLNSKAGIRIHKSLLHSVARECFQIDVNFSTSEHQIRKLEKLGGEQSKVGQVLTEGGCTPAGNEGVAPEERVGPQLGTSRQADGPDHRYKQTRCHTLIHIQDLTSGDWWHHVPSEHNLIDDISKGLLPVDEAYAPTYIVIMTLILWELQIS